MQRTVKALRIALPIVFLAFLGVIIANWTASRGRGARKPAEAVTSTQRPQDAPLVEGKAFRDVQTIGGRVVSEIVATRIVSFQSGWTTLEGVTLTLYRANGLTYVISCPEAQFNSKTKEAEAKGGVRVTSSDNIEIKTAEIRYDGARLTNDIPVEFKVDRWNGKAGALDLDVEGETLRLHKQVDATMVPSQPAEVPMTLRGVESIFRRRENIVEFRDQVQMDRGADSLRADFMTGRFTQDRRQLIGMEGQRNCVIVVGANQLPGEDLGGRKTITSDSFNTELGPDGQINAFNAISAENIARAVLDGPPRREITARNFRVAIANRLIQEIKADWQVVMKEMGPETRQINAEHVTVYYDQTTRRARSAHLEGAFRYADPKNTASAFRANYDIAGDKIILTTDPGWQATVVADGQILKAKQIEFSPRAQVARASGSVIAQLVGKGKGGGPTADATNLFPSAKPVFVNADELIMRQQQKIAVFTGNVKAWQDSNTILAHEMQVQGNGDSITARGNVRTLLYNTSGAEARKAPMQTTSDQLIARRGERRVEFLGKVNIVDETRNLKSEKATLFLDENRKVQRMEAETAVAMSESSTGRKGAGDKAIYHVDKKMIYVFGTPAKISDPNGDVSGQQIVFDVARDRVQVLSPDGKTKGTYKHEGP
ncbi:MAG TPA: LPS export ABC transporter periplasmic protein LptC [Thermoanaerobaculia bacterium]|nr:LPS export ABC transporter periplasmic protein LptC [Thermoanaerobaculia bacterium]